MQRRIRVGVLGATGLVGQELLRRLDGHPWFAAARLGASERSAGRRYAEAVRWGLSGDPPASLAELPVVRCEPDAFGDCRIVLSALGASVAREIEPQFVGAGLAVVSNSSAFRQQQDVPLVIPEVNAEHLELIERRARPAHSGFLVANPNCSATGLTLALAPLHRRFGVRRVVVTTLQAISGAGMRGPRAIELADNVVPHVAGEEPKIEQEVPRILGTLGAAGIEPAPVVVSAHCHRVSTLAGHLEALSVELEQRATSAEIEQTLSEFRGQVAGLGLPSAPQPPLVLRREADRPQPRLDRDAGDGMAVVIGRIRPCPVLGAKFALLSHNTVRGAAGGALLNAELLVARGLVSESRP
jgi:aspartate-semialdehyde dehydrogenase